MRSLVLGVYLVLVPAAAAQEIYCEGTASNPAGEVIAGYTLREDGATKSVLLSWMPVRDRYESFDAEFMTSPRLMLHYRLGQGGRLAGPTDANVITTQYSVPDAGAAASLALVRIEAIASPSGKTISWKGSEPGKGEPQLARLVREEQPERLAIRLSERGKVTANAEFDLRGRADIAQMAVAATAAADRNVASYRKLVADGKKPRACPQ